MVNLPKAFVTAFMVSCVENSAWNHRVSPVVTTTHSHPCLQHPPRVTMGYVPDGLSNEQYEDIKRKDFKDTATKKTNLDRVGVNLLKRNVYDAKVNVYENTTTNKTKAATYRRQRRGLFSRIWW